MLMRQSSIVEATDDTNSTDILDGPVWDVANADIRIGNPVVEAASNPLDDLAG